MSDDWVLELQAVSKRFCPSLKRSLWYGVHDILRSVLGNRDPSPALRSGEFWAVDNVSTRLRRGEALGLIGPNGAGKTTLLRMINGLIMPDRGDIRVRGRVGAMIALGTGFNPLLSGRENVYINGSVLGMSRREINARFEQIVEFAEIGGFIDNPVRTYSSGMNMRLGFAIAGHVRPDLLLIDEVLAVGDVGFRMKCFRHLRQLREQGTAVVVVTHNMNDLQRVANRCMVLAGGRLHTEGPLQQAVAEYQRLNFARTGEGEAPHAEARLLSCETLNQAGNLARRFSVGEPLVLRIRIDAGPAGGDFHLIVNLAGPDVESIMSVTSAVRFLAPGRHEVLFTLNECPLLPGGYHFHVSLYGRGATDIHHRIRHAADFAVLGRAGDRRVQQGLVSIPHTWSFPG